MRDTLEELGVLLIIGPLTLRDDFDIKVNVKALARWAAFKLSNKLI